MNYVSIHHHLLGSKVNTQSEKTSLILTTHTF